MNFRNSHQKRVIKRRLGFLTGQGFAEMGRRGGGAGTSMATKDDYRFLNIADAFASINQKVSLIGVIVDHSLPKQSKGTDYCCSVRIVDASYPSHGLLVNFFTESMDKLPQVESAGDIILVFHVVIKAYNKEINAVFNKRFSGFALYEGKYGQSFTPYQVSSNFRTREQDKEFIADLRKWMDSAKLDTVSKESILLREIRRGEQLDLVCKVTGLVLACCIVLCCKILHMCEVNQDELMLLVWDGTDAPCLPIHEKLDNEKESPLPLHFGERLSRDILCEFPTVGTVLRVKFERRVRKLDPSSFTVGRWVQFINLAFEVHAGLWYGIFVPSTRIRYVPDEDRLVLKCLRDSEERFSAKWDRMPFTSFPWPQHLTETEKEDVALVTLMDIMNFSQVTAKFKCVVRVVAMVPSNPMEFRSPTGIYRIRLTLEDPTARIHAYLYGEDAELFFDGYPGIDELTQKRNTFLGIGDGKAEDAPRNPPWMICCIKSYYLDKTNMWETRNYRIFETRLLC